MTEVVETVETEAVEVAEGEPVEAVEEQTPEDDALGKVRAEAAENRVKAREASERGDQLFELLKSQTIAAGTAGILRDASDLPDGEYLDDNGFPSVEAVQLAATALIAQKPYLAAPVRDTSQGPQAGVPVLSFGDMIRAGM